MAFYIYEYLKPKEEENIEGSNLMDQDAASAEQEGEKKSYLGYKICIITTFVCTLIVNIVGYCLDAYRV